MLPVKVEGNCAAKFSDKEAINVGGVSYDNEAVSETFIYSTESNQWSTGPNLSEGRFVHRACGSVLDSQNSEV